MELGERKKQILQAIIDDYIRTAEPIGSRTIARNHGINLSPATIRNEMADLEEMGYLEKPHTSAGRVPSKSGYRFYVNSLMHECRLTIEETNTLNQALQLRMKELDDIIAEVSDVVSRFTDYTVVATSPKAINPTVKSLKLLPLTQHSFLLAVMTSAGSVKNAGIECREDYRDEDVYDFSKELFSVLQGRSPLDLTEDEFLKIKNSSRNCKSLYAPVIAHLFDWFDKSAKTTVHSGGVGNIFNHPEYRDIEKAKQFISFIGNRDNIYSIMSDNSSDDIKIMIGDENKFDVLKDCSVVISNYDIGGNLRGSIGVVGPMRMNYSKIISSLDLITERLNLIINNMFFNE